MFNKHSKPPKAYSWRKFRRALMGLVVGLALSVLLLWLIGIVFESSFNWSLGLSAVFVFLLCPLLIQWVMDKFRHPEDGDGSNVPNLLRLILTKIFFK